jgi:hypothetical protein
MFMSLLRFDNDAGHGNRCYHAGRFGLTSFLRKAGRPESPASFCSDLKGIISLVPSAINTRRTFVNDLKAPGCSANNWPTVLLD